MDYEKNYPTKDERSLLAFVNRDWMECIDSHKYMLRIFYKLGSI